MDYKIVLIDTISPILILKGYKTFGITRLSYIFYPDIRAMCNIFVCKWILFNDSFALIRSATVKQKPKAIRWPKLVGQHAQQTSQVCVRASVWVCVCESNKRKTFRDIWEIQLLTTKYATFWQMLWQLQCTKASTTSCQFWPVLVLANTSAALEPTKFLVLLNIKSHTQHTLAPRTAKLFKLCTNCSWQRWNARHAPCAKAFNLFTHCTQWVHSESVLAFRFLAKYLRIAVTREREREINREREERAMSLM